MGVEEAEEARALAASAAFFWVLSLIPFLLLIMNLLQFTPVTRTDLLNIISVLFPYEMENLITPFLDQAERQTTATVSIALITALWSASKGMMAVISGINWVWGHIETGGYWIRRVKATLYMIGFLVSIVICMVFLVFGDSIGENLSKSIPEISNVINQIIHIRGLASFTVLFCVFLAAYVFLPRRKVRVRYQIPGSLFATVGWMISSYGLALYVDYSANFSAMYGSLTTIILIMLWFYLSMNLLILGAKINYLFYERIRIPDVKKGKWRRIVDYLDN